MSGRPLAEQGLPPSLTFGSRQLVGDGQKCVVAWSPTRENGGAQPKFEGRSLGLPYRPLSSSLNLIFLTSLLFVGVFTAMSAHTAAFVFQVHPRTALFSSSIAQTALHEKRALRVSSAAQCALRKYPEKDQVDLDDIGK